MEQASTQKSLESPLRNSLLVDEEQPVIPTPSTPPRYDVLPPGWSTATSDNGRVYYYEDATGKTSWTHPLAATPGLIDDTRQAERAYWNKQRVELRRPSNLLCYALTTCLLCPPIGFIALYHSRQVNVCWNAGKFQDAHRHHNGANQWACLGSFIGIGFWLYWFLVREASPWRLDLLNLD